MRSHQGMEAHANEVPVTIKVLIQPSISRKSNFNGYPCSYICRRRPLMKGTGCSGRKVLANNQVINYTNGGSFTYNATVPYNDG